MEDVIADPEQQRVFYGLVREFIVSSVTVLRSWFIYSELLSVNKIYYCSPFLQSFVLYIYTCIKVNSG